MAFLLVLGLKSILPRQVPAAAQVSPRVIHLKDSIYFIDSTPSARSRRWIFGDGNFSARASGTHRYNAPGNYVVTLILNETIRDSFFIRVEGSAYRYTAADSVFKIIAPPAVLQHENVLFRAQGYGSDAFLWDFGDGSPPRTTELSVVRHTYRRPGVFKVSLQSRNNAGPATHRLVVAPGFEWPDTPSLPVLGAKMPGEEEAGDFRDRLQKIVEEGRAGRHYLYLLNRYACGKADLPVEINDTLSQPLYLYCQNLIFNHKLVVRSVELTFDPDGRCVVAARVRQHR